MMEWLNVTLAEQSADPSIVWKASTQHYPLFGMHYDDTEDIITTLMPLLKEHNFDVYFNGHEHQMNYAFAPDKLFEETKKETETISFYEKLANLVINHMKKSCFSNYEYFGKFPEVRDEPRTVIFEKGDKLHQLTIGASGRGLYNICPKHLSQGTFEYSQNKHYGYSLVSITPDKFRMEIRGIPQTEEQLYQYSIAQKWGIFNTVSEWWNGKKDNADDVLFTVEILAWGEGKNEEL
jgi:hypothetical protein